MPLKITAHTIPRLLCDRCVTRYSCHYRERGSFAPSRLTPSMFRDRDTLSKTMAHETVLACLEAGIDAANPARVIPEHLRYDPDGDQLMVAGELYDLRNAEHIYVVGGGNAAGAIAQALEAALGDAIDAGAVVTDVPRETDTVETLRGDHPIPSERGVKHTAQMADIAANAGENDLVIAVIGGGGSALMPAPVEGVALEDMRSLTDELLRSGATIDEINAVRKHLSTLKGGQLARTAAPAQVISLLFSDVVGDDSSVIASGPTVPDSTTFAMGIDVIERYDVSVSQSIRNHLDDGNAGEVPETPGPESDIFDHVSTHILANGMTAIEAATETARERGYTPLVLSSRMRGEARESALSHVAIAEECLASGQPVEPPAVLLSGGEVTVTVRGDGAGGPNQEFALSGAIELPEGVVLGSVDTDGIDGPTDVAGALVDSDTVSEGAVAADALDTNDVYPFLDERDALLVTGETGTNVNDLRVLVVERPDR